MFQNPHTEQGLSKSMRSSKKPSYIAKKTQSLVWIKLNSIVVLFVRLLPWSKLIPLRFGGVQIHQGATYATT